MKNFVLIVGGARRYEEIMSDDITTDCFDTPECPLSNESCLQRCGRREDSTNNYFTGVVCPFIFSENMVINRVYFFIAILCIALVLHPAINIFVCTHIELSKPESMIKAFNKNLSLYQLV
ncbi:hypothetical protein RYX36_009968 [Vicia faba]